jgi:hypothetical protein
MPVFDFNVNGEIISIDAPTAKEAADTLSKMKDPVTFGGLGKQALASLGTGTAYLAGLPGTMRDIGTGIEKKLLKKGYELATGKPPSATGEGRAERFFAEPGAETERTLGPMGASLLRYLVQGPVANMPTAQETTKGLETLTGGFTAREPRNVPEEYVRTVSEFAPVAAATEIATGGLGLLPMMLDAVIPAGLSETAGQLARRYAPERPSWMPDWVPSAETIARLGGAVSGPAAVSVTRRVITPHPTNPVRIKAAERLDKEGVEFTAGQKTGNNTMRYRESEVGGPAVQDMMDRQAEQFTGAALKRIGVTAKRATPEVMTEAYHRIGSMFDTLSAANRLVPDRQMVNELYAAARKYSGDVSKSNRAPVVQNTLRDIIADMQTGTISGSRYANYITRLREAGMSGPGDKEIALRAFRKALDDAMERSIQKNNPTDLGKWRIARNNYRDLSAIEDVLTTGARHEENLITPTALDQATLRHAGKRAYVQGKYDLAELAKAGKLILKELPQSGTVPRAMARAGPQILNVLKGGGLMGAIGSILGGPTGAAIGTGIGAVGGPAVSSLYRRSLMSKPVQDYLKNQRLTQQPPLLGEQPAGGLLRVLEQSESARRARDRPPYAGGRRAD